ncbi:hypothetical protein SFRURICE_006888, partial [Spodoptera frugiperda]
QFNVFLNESLAPHLDCLLCRGCVYKHTSSNPKQQFVDHTKSCFVRESNPLTANRAIDFPLYRGCVYKRTISDTNYTQTRINNLWIAPCGSRSSPLHVPRQPIAQPPRQPCSQKGIIYSKSIEIIYRKHFYNNPHSDYRFVSNCSLENYE